MADDSLYYALLADGTGDRALLPIIEWSLRRLCKEGSFAPPSFVPRQHASIEERLDEIVERYRPDLVFVHRDAESQPYETRLKEIPTGDTIVPVIPVRMTEAWLLIDEGALGRSAGNPNGRQPLDMPPVSQLERLPDPKSLLRRLLRIASGNTGRRARRFDKKRSEAVHRLASLISDYSVLSGLPAFRHFFDCLEQALKPFVGQS